jgi:hypothetical protein
MDSLPTGSLLPNSVYRIAKWPRQNCVMPSAAQAIASGRK